jgi:hypothetical protein
MGQLQTTPSLYVVWGRPPPQGVHKPLKAVAFNANGIGKGRFELSKQLEGRHIDAALLSEANLKSRERFFIPNYQVYRTDRFPGLKGETAVAVRNITIT